MRSVNELGTLISWLETKDPSRRYDYSNCYKCLLFQYYSEMGCPVNSVDSTAWFDANGQPHPLPEHFNNISKNNCTFGGALADARAIANQEAPVAA